MAKNFEIIFNLDAPMVNLDHIKIKWTLEAVQSVLEKHNCKYIIAPHIPDDLSGFNHLHCGIHTESDNTYPTIAKWFNLAPNSVNKINNRFETTYALYVIHYNQVNKTPVDPNAVITNFNLDYSKLIKNIENKANDDIILNDIASGKITEYDLYNTMTEEWCRKHIRQINDALVVRSKKMQVKKEQREMQVVYITGPARCGKSYLATKLCADNNFSYFITSQGEHPFDDYMGQEAVILDDVRPSDFKFNELLKILDNHMSSKVSARYHNIDLNCKVIYITCVLPLSDFYGQLQNNNKEATEQLSGRIGTLCELTKDTLNISLLQNDNKTYKPYAYNIPNPILSDADFCKMSENKRQEYILNTFKGIANMADYAVKNIENFNAVDNISF